ncbi:MAG TPA: CocE/NonD family hydrolase [Acidobacteriaceae bacterium]|nr:CocE/NonD family hydrolase [Acidobacteriaceae bacterium]
MRQQRLLVSALIAGSSFFTLAGRAAAQQQPRTREEMAQIAARTATEDQLEKIAVIDRKVMIPMKDGKSMAADVYYPRGDAEKYPTIFVRTPYNFNYWDVSLGAPRDMSAELEAVKRGYAYVEINERGHFFSQGNYDILGPPLSDGYEEFSWIAAQPWSNGKVGTIGCSSTAEWQLAVTAMGNQADAAFIPMGFGAGVGRVGPYYEQGNWYRGGAVQMLFIDWLYGEQNQVRPMFPPGSSRKDLILASKSFDLADHFPPVDWSVALRHLPEKDIIEAVGGPVGIFSDPMPVATGGKMIQRTPNDPAWYKGGLWNDSMKINVPGLWFMSWYDVSIGPNLATYNFVRRTARPDIANEQYAVIAPTGHCGYTRGLPDPRHLSIAALGTYTVGDHTVVGERDMGDVRLDTDKLTYGWFDHFLKGEDNHVLETMPKIQYYVMGANRWETANTWPPEGSTTRTFYLGGGGKANSLYGDGLLTSAPATKTASDHFTYDPMNPVPSYGGNVCCEGNALIPGSMDQQKMETRNDILVYTSAPFTEGTEVSGPVNVTLYVSSDAKDTDFTVKLIDVDEHGTAYNLDENIQRMRYRDGYDKPLVWMKSGEVYKVTFQPMQTSDYFPAGHSLRVEVSSSNFPRFDRNLNTGGNNWDETTGVTAHNAVYHSAQYPSQITVTINPNPHPM